MMWETYRHKIHGFPSIEDVIELDEGLGVALALIQIDKLQLGQIDLIHNVHLPIQISNGQAGREGR